MPDARLRRTPKRRPRHAGDPQLGTSWAHEPRREPAIDREERALVRHPSRHLIEDAVGEVQPLVEQPPASLEIGAEERKLALHPAGRHGRHDPTSREQVQRRQLLENDERVALRHDERRDAQLEATRAGCQVPERDERLGDRPVYRGVLLGYDHVIGDEAGVETRLLSSKRGRDEALGGKTLTVVRKDEAEMEPSHWATLSLRRSSRSSNVVNGRRERAGDPLRLDVGRDGRDHAVLLHQGRYLGWRRGEHRLKGRGIVEVGGHGDVVGPVDGDVIGHIGTTGRPDCLGAIHLAVQKALDINNGVGRVMVTSKEALLRGPDEIRTFLQRYVRGTATYSWTWDRREASAAGAPWVAFGRGDGDGSGGRP